MRRLDKRGTAAWEFCLVGGLFFTVIFCIFDLGRYLITMQSLRMLANAGARATIICYTNTVIINKQSPSNCPTDPLSDSSKQTIAPFLYAGGLQPTLNASPPSGGGTVWTVTASQPSFTMLMPIWGTALNAPSTSTSIPF